MFFWSWWQKSPLWGQLLCNRSDVIGLKATAPAYVPDPQVVGFSGVLLNIPSGCNSGLQHCNTIDMVLLLPPLFSNFFFPMTKLNFRVWVLQIAHFWLTWKPLSYAISYHKSVLYYSCSLQSFLFCHKKSQDCSYAPELTKGIFREIQKPSFATVGHVEPQGPHHQGRFQFCSLSGFLHEAHCLQAGPGSKSAVHTNNWGPCAKKYIYLLVSQFYLLVYFLKLKSSWFTMLC